MRGDLTCPPDKSVTHRSVMLAAMAHGKSRILRPLLGADCRSTMGVFQALGVRIALATGQGGAPDEVVVDSPGWDGWSSPVAPLDFGNSGTTARLLTGVFAATPGLFVTAFGDGSLSKRPMGRVVEPLRSVGARVAGRETGRLLPFAIEGARLTAAHHRIDKASAQVKSALLLAGLNITGETTVTLPAGSRDHTERMLAALGATCTTRRDGADETVTVRGPFRPPPRVYEVPGDPSSAAFFLCHAAMLEAGQVTVRGVLDNVTRTGFLTVLERMGARLSRSPARTPQGLLEPIHDLTVAGGATLRPVDVEAELAPTLIDEIPVLAATALFAAGTSRFRGLAELRIKESDRLAKTLELLAAVGGKAWSEGDDLVVEGVRGGPATLKAFHFDPAADHRLAMTAAVLARVTSGPCKIDDPDCVAVSFPGFFGALEGLAP